MGCHSARRFEGTGKIAACHSARVRDFAYCRIARELFGDELDCPAHLAGAKAAPFRPERPDHDVAIGADDMVVKSHRHKVREERAVNVSMSHHFNRVAGDAVHDGIIVADDFDTSPPTRR